MLSVTFFIIMLSDVMSNVVRLSVVASHICNDANDSRSPPGDKKTHFFSWSFSSFSALQKIGNIW